MGSEILNRPLVGPEGPDQCSAKGPETIDVPPELLQDLSDADLGRAGQLAALTQGPLVHKSVRLWGWGAGGGSIQEKGGWKVFVRR